MPEHTLNLQITFWLPRWTKERMVTYSDHLTSIIYTTGHIEDLGSIWRLRMQDWFFSTIYSYLLWELIHFLSRLEHSGYCTVMFPLRKPWRPLNKSLSFIFSQSLQTCFEFVQHIYKGGIHVAKFLFVFLLLICLLITGAKNLEG